MCQAQIKCLATYIDFYTHHTDIAATSFARGAYEIRREWRDSVSYWSLDKVGSLTLVDGALGVTVEMM